MPPAPLYLIDFHTSYGPESLVDPPELVTTLAGSKSASSSFRDRILRGSPLLLDSTANYDRTRQKASLEGLEFEYKPSAGVIMAASTIPSSQPAVYGKPNRLYR